MSLENTIALVASEVGQVREENLGLVNVAGAQIARVGDRYDEILASQVKYLYVDQENGDDTNEGTEASPLKEIQAALDLVPRGGLCAVSLMNPYHISTDVRIAGKFLSMIGLNGTKHAITFERATTGSATPLRFPSGFLVADGGILAGRDLRIQIPELDSYSAFIPANVALIRASELEYWHPLQFSLTSCEIVIPAQPFCALTNSSSLVAANIHACTYPGAITDPRGRLFQQLTNTAGTDPNTVPWLLTNLTSV